MRIVHIVIWRDEGQGEKWIHGYGDRWKSPESTDILTTDSLLSYLRTVLNSDSPPTPEERARAVIAAWRQDQDLEPLIINAIQAAIDADREAR